MLGEVPSPHKVHITSETAAQQTTSPRSICHAGQAAPFLKCHISSINSRINSWINGKLKRNQMTSTVDTATFES